MKPDLATIIRRHAHKLEPIPTGRTPRLTKLPGIRAVLFDIYGTLLVSGAGEVGTAVETDSTAALQETFRDFGMPDEIDAAAALEMQRQVIRDEHARLHGQGIDHPEVDIVAVWQETLSRLNVRDVAPRGALEWLALIYENRKNPVWPMPNVEECLSALRGAGLLLGIISNAQFFTPPLFPALFSSNLSELGFDEEICLFSWRSGVAKPDRKLFGLAVDALARRRISPAETLYVGNDMLNDVAGAAGVGFRTALFSGDTRSLRLRQGDARISGIEPDLELTDLSQLPSCLTTSLKS